jgi:AcrR family transcriptional regulator
MAGTRKDVRARLLTAALDVFSERGFDGATAGDIADRARVTERTYFRHFADKREVLFDGADSLGTQLEAAVTGVPSGPSPVDMVIQAVRTMIPSLEEDAELKRRRQRVIAAAPELLERERTKNGHLASCAALALVARGVPEPVAALAATSAVEVLVRAREDWLSGASDDLAALLVARTADLRAAIDGS